jgi:hypothetical protein
MRLYMVQISALLCRRVAFSAARLRVAQLRYTPFLVVKA